MTDEKTEKKPDPTLKTRYLRDPKNQERVVTLVTKVVGNTLTYAFAVNSPISHDPWGRPGDRFTRRTGSMIALGRLKSKKAVQVTFDPTTEHPFVVALVKLAESKTSVARIARSVLKGINDRGGLKTAASETTKAA